MLSLQPGQSAGSSVPGIRGVWVAFILLASVMIGATAGLLTWAALGQSVVVALFAGAGALATAASLGLKILEVLLGRDS